MIDLIVAILLSLVMAAPAPRAEVRATITPYIPPIVTPAPVATMAPYPPPYPAPDHVQIKRADRLWFPVVTRG